ncbi:phenol 2-monooxygenase [Mytilinidion resinicola]|uniref:Phenol 2-monooxygenase n=1 Tax=Mytilinidion resinicola TaxID=574789 RepID=A0A6A6YEI6_9PEZI|nr:phenol 2-monooxygenase [Mytilinidion resinicola]KAF2806978.1 phenol 2-monooxygenase [Mytilinidion resinicola]
MTATIWDIMKRKPSSQRSLSSSPSPKMSPGLKTESLRSVSTAASSMEVVPANGQPERPSFSDVVVVGAGPAGLMLADNLVRFGIKTEVVDNRPEMTSTGRADGLQPKTVETLRQMRLAEPLLRKGVKVYDIAFWRSTLKTKLQRTGREIHYPPFVDLLDPYILLVHQGMIEKLFIDDMAERGVGIRRNTAFMDYHYTPEKTMPLEAVCKDNVGQTKKNFGTKYIVGCDGAHSMVRKCLPDSRPEGASHDAIWGVLDGQIDTDFPDFWSKAVISSEERGSVLMIPRERNLTRLYIELKSDAREGTTREELSQDFVMKRAQEIMSPFYLRWKSVEWFSRYQIGQRVASRFTDDVDRVFIAGDASHTHSPKAAQGMNTSMHDTWNLAWKLNFAVRGLAKPSLLATYEQERRKIAQDLINFDYEHANAFANGDSKALAENFRKNVAFISGFGTTYEYNVLNIPSKGLIHGSLTPGCLPPPAKVTRYMDANPVDIQNDIPALGQFRIYFFAHNVHDAKPFLDTVCASHISHSSTVGKITSAGNASYTIQPPLDAPHDGFVCPERYTPVSTVFTYSLVTDMSRNDVEIADLTQVLRDSRWTFYLDDVPEMDTRKQTCIDKWLGGLDTHEVAVVNVRPDGYVGAFRSWPVGTRESGLSAIEWMDRYYEGFMKGH